GHGHPEQDPHPPQGVRPLGHRDRRQGDRRDRDADRCHRLGSRAASDGEERLRRPAVRLQGQGLTGALRDPHPQAAHRHPAAHPEDRRLASAPRPPPGGRRHRDQAGRL
ncbi:MAG: SSU ribosomal protein S10p (S20e), partial [uncultured Solirubrobacteraceae bacterium]